MINLQLIAIAKLQSGHSERSQTLVRSARRRVVYADFHRINVAGAIDELTAEFARKYLAPFADVRTTERGTRHMILVRPGAFNGSSRAARLQPGTPENADDSWRCSTVPRIDRGPNRIPRASPPPSCARPPRIQTCGCGTDLANPALLLATTTFARRVASSRSRRRRARSTRSSSPTCRSISRSCVTSWRSGARFSPPRSTQSCTTRRCMRIIPMEKPRVERF